MPSNQKSIVKLFEENELNISLLYNLYSQNIPGHESFWKKISDEEIMHAKAIAGAFQKTESEDDHFKENNFTRGIIKYISDFVTEKTIEAGNNCPTHAKALETALRVEQSMLEKKCFEVFIPTSDSLQKVLKRLNQETERHVARLRQELEKVMKKEIL